MSTPTSPNGAAAATLPILVIAKYNFKGRNNDELTFNKNDIITVTQQLDGGWWEGSVADKVGWFPSAFVGIVQTQSSKENGTRAPIVLDEEAIESSRRKFRSEILSGTDGFLNKEADHVAKLLQIANEYIPVIEEHNALPVEELRPLAVCLTEIIEAKRALLQQLHHALTKPVAEQKLGAIFLEEASILRTLLITYCKKHPHFIPFLVEKRAKVEDALKTENLLYKNFIAGLSLVFRHTVTYASILQEVEHNTSTSHPDRGNLQRACAVYREIAAECAMVRKQEEIQIEFIGLGVLERTIGKNFAQKLGRLIYINSITILPTTAKQQEDATTLRDRYLVLFTNSCLLYEISIQKNEYTLKEQFPTQGTSVQKDETAIKFLLYKGSKLLVTINALSAEDYRGMSQALEECPFSSIRIAESNAPEDEADSAPITRTAEVPRSISLSPTKQLDRRPPPPAAHNTASSSKKNSSTSNGNIRLNSQVEMIVPEATTPASETPSTTGETRAVKPPLGPSTPDASPTKNVRSARLYSGWCLRPYPPPRGVAGGGLQTTTSSSSIKMRKGLTIEEQEDAYLLKVVEGYCGPPTAVGNLANSFSRSQFSSSSLSAPRRAASCNDDVRPQLIMADDEKLFVEELEGDEIVVKEKSLVDTVYALKDQVNSLQKEVSSIQKTLDKEQRARRRLDEVSFQICAH